MTASEAATTQLTDLVATLADNKYFLGRRYAEWCTAAPALESAVAAAAMAQDEIGHARSFYPLLQDLAGISPETEPETRTRFVNAEFLNRPFEGWTDFVAANFLFDTSLTVLLEAAEKSTAKALAQRARRVVEEERLHWLHGEGWTRRLAREGAPVRARLGESFKHIAPEALRLFDAADPSLVRQAVLECDADGLRARLRSRVNRVLTDLEMAEI